MHTHDAPAKTDMFVSRQAPARGNGVDDGQQDVAITWCRYKQFLSFTKQNTENTRQQDNRTGTRLGLEAVPPLHAHNQSDTNKSRESKKIGTERLRKVLRAAGVASIRGADALRSQNLVIVPSKRENCERMLGHEEVQPVTRVDINKDIVSVGTQTQSQAQSQTR